MHCARQEEQDDASKPPSFNPASLHGGQQSQAGPNMKVAVRKAKKKDEGAIWQPEEFKAASGVVVKEQACVLCFEVCDFATAHSSVIHYLWFAR